MNTSRLLAVSALTAGLLGAGACQLEDDEPREQAEEPQAVGACVYENPFSKAEECKLYVGQTFTPETAATDCSSYVFGAPGAFTEGGTCEYPETLGTCIVEDGTAYEYALVFPGDDPSDCASTRNGCEVFAKGRFEPSALCEGAGGGGGGAGSVFVQPYLECKDPLEAPEGQSADGQVCTWTLISASTEEGRRYQDYASCEDVLTQRPYYASPPAATTLPDDARLGDAAYLAEVAWAREQVEASACICCHSTGLAPNGPSQWFVEAEGIWLDSISDSGLAMMAGLADSSAFGAFPPEENNGFDRTLLGVPTTDNARMQALLLGEWERRGFSPEDAADIPAFGGPLVDQREYEPVACVDGEGVDAEGRLIWSGGDARYLYVLEPGSENPGVPPNLDEPAGTLWLADVPTLSPAFSSGVALGELRGDMRTRVPAGAAPSALSSGETYVLYVLADIGIPLARCLFEAP
ncbi:MAG: proteinase inhibitor [Polyangiaceae bacterium]|nr:proteinase inhibitor [Polyangiaceae bacterium]